MICWGLIKCSEYYTVLINICDDMIQTAFATLVETGWYINKILTTYACKRVEIIEGSITFFMDINVYVPKMIIGIFFSE